MDDLPLGVIVAGFIGFATVFFYVYSRSWTTQGSNERGTKARKTSTAGNSLAPTRLKNVWDVPQNSKTASVKRAHGDKPFGSKYYYAHNNPNATGGYKDGLKMEDYVMNGPRLLRKGDKVLSSDNTVESRTLAVEGAMAETLEPAKDGGKVQHVVMPIRTIVKYQWDDPGDWNGFATIRIDTLPNKTGSPIDWKSVKVNEVNADLVGEGLLVIVNTDECKYQLKLAKLYGDAADVKAVMKPKRLLVRITKKKNSVLAVRKESNLEAWPQPHRKI